MKRFTPSPLHLIADVLIKTKPGKLYKQKQQKTQELTAYVKAHLTAEQQTHLVRAHVEGHGLYLVADSSAWTTRLRYAAMSILSHLRTEYPQEYAGLTQIKVQVARGAL